MLAGFRASAELVVLGAALAFVASRFAVVAALVLAPFAVALAVVRRALKRRHERAALHAERLHASVDELLDSVDLWRTYGAELRVRQHLNDAAQRAALSSARAEAARSALSGANEILAAAALVVVAAAAQIGRLPTANGSIVAFAAIALLMYRPLRDIGDARTFMERGAEALHALEALARDPDAQPLPSAVGPVRTPRTRPWVRGALDVDDLAVTPGAANAPMSSDAWARVRFRAAPGEIVALVGPTGAGKTTLLRALLGLEEATSGRVRYGGVELTAAGVGPDVRPFAWVPQEPAIVVGSLRENVALGAADPDAALEALAAIGAERLSARADDRLTAGGPELSGGERQLVAIARAVASDQPILLLDEPTAGLDAHAQARVLAALERLRGTRTIVLVTHRPEPLTIADRVAAIGRADAGSADEPANAAERSAIP